MIPGAPLHACAAERGLRDKAAVVVLSVSAVAPHRASPRHQRAHLNDWRREQARPRVQLFLGSITFPNQFNSAATLVVEIEVGEAHVWIWRDADIGHGNGDAAHLANLATRKGVDRRAAVRVLVAAKPVDFHKARRVSRRWCARRCRSLRRRDLLISSN
jgi:hypothetical protein